eukprot:764098-Hanusia_phi.AAC.3
MIEEQIEGQGQERRERRLEARRRKCKGGRGCGRWKCEGTCSGFVITRQPRSQGRERPRGCLKIS